MDEFYQKISDWLGAFGYVKIYQINGANKNYQEFHFIKDQIRVVCKKEFSEEYCYLSTDILKVKEPMSLRTGKYAIGTTSSGSWVFHCAVKDNIQTMTLCTKGLGGGGRRRMSSARS